MSAPMGAMSLQDYDALRALYAEAVRALEEHKIDGEFGGCVGCGYDSGHRPDCAVHAVLSRPEAQTILKGDSRG